MCLGRNCAFRIACFQCLQNIVKLPFAMCPAACNPKFIRSFTGKLVIYLISIGNENAFVVFQEFSWYIAASPVLVFVEEEWVTAVGLRGMVYPHVRLAVWTLIRGNQLKRCLIAMNQPAFQHLLMHSAVDDLYISVGNADHPVCKCLTGNIHIHSLEIFCLTGEWECIHIFAAEDSCCETWRQDAVWQKLFRRICNPNAFAMFACIFEYMVFMLHKLCGNKLHRVVGVMGKNIISARKILIQRFFRNGMFINDRFQILQIDRRFPFRFVRLRTD